MTKHISILQGADISGRGTVTSLTPEIIPPSKKKQGKKDLVVIKADFSKAFDRLQLSLIKKGP